MQTSSINGKDSFAEEGTGLVWLLLHFSTTPNNAAMPSNDQIVNRSCSFGEKKMATLFEVVEKYTHNRFQLSESVPFIGPQATIICSNARNFSCVFT